MMAVLKQLTIVAILVALTPPIDAADAVVTVRSLLEEMVDRDRLPQLPTMPFIAGQASSYDRASIAPDKPGWFANHDFGMYIRTETSRGRTEYVMMDVDGPGAITRWWEGDHEADAVIRVYLDGSDKPAIEENIDKLLSGTGQIKPPLAAITCLGLNSYFPIPYARHCKVTYDKIAEHHWYNIGYRTYPAGTKVTSYSPAEYAAASDELDRVQRELSESNRVAAPIAAEISTQTRTLQPQGVLAASLAGPVAIRQLSVQRRKRRSPRSAPGAAFHGAFDCMRWRANRLGARRRFFRQRRRPESLPRPLSRNSRRRRHALLVDHAVLKKVPY